MTINFLDIMIVDTDTINFLLTIFPNLGKMLLGAFAVAVPVFVLIWRRDSYRVRRRLAAAGIAASLFGLTAVSFAVPTENWEIFVPGSHISKFARSGVESLSELWQHGMFEADAATNADHLPTGAIGSGASCPKADKAPNIILVHDESSFDIRAVPNLKVPDNYGAHFRSFDGKQRKFMVESNGGSSWFAEYNVLAGLSSRSYGRFSYFLTRVAAGRVERGLPRTLQRCGYETFTLYPSLGAFMSARGFHTSIGIEHFLDQKALGTDRVEPDSFYYNKAADIFAKGRGTKPVFMFVYLAANHYPWTDRWRPDLLPEWKDLGNPPKVDEYLRRQTMSAQYYSEFLARLKREFPLESFLVVRYGDHQPELTANLI
jgi:phosphoglycerol transferase MdoB-like AlkP superfamily enzyme